MSHISNSKAQSIERCPHQAWARYIEHAPKAPTSVAAQLGKAGHAVQYRLVDEHVRAERVSPLSEERALQLWEEEFAVHDLAGLDCYQDGERILRAWIGTEGIVDYRDVIGAEVEFRIPISEDRPLWGFIDRVDRWGDDGITIRDYKWGRWLPSREEVDADLQLSCYALAASHRWPWAKRVRLVLENVRHGVKISTERTPDQLASTGRYLLSLLRQFESATEYPASPGPLCPYCDYRQSCPAYTDALEDKHRTVCDNLEDLDQAAREQQDLSARIKILTKRKEEVEAAIKPHLNEHEELALAGKRYRLLNVAKKSHKPLPTLELLASKTSLGRDEVLARIGSIENKRLDRFLKSLDGELSKSDRLLLTRELDARADKSYSQRLWAKDAEVSK